MDSWGLSAEFRYHGELDRGEKLAFLQNLSVLSVPDPYDDPKGHFLLEAMASGIPVVKPRRGAFTEIVETIGGGLLAEPDNPDALARGILDLWRNPSRRMELGARAYEAVPKHYSAARMSEMALEVYHSVLKQVSHAEPSGLPEGYGA
jgi:glycosyltransferase involved in cell wall biosynthesis